MKRGVCRQAGILPEPCSGSPAVDVTANNFAAFLGMRRCKNWAHKNLLLKKFNYLKAYSASFSQSTVHLIPDLYPELLSGDVVVHVEKEMATHSSVLAWRISGTEEPGGLPSVGSHRVGHD